MINGKFKIEIDCEEWWVADSLHQLGSKIECTDILDEMVNNTIDVEGEHYKARITKID